MNLKKERKTGSTFSPQGVVLYSCSDMAHKQALWGIKSKDLDYSENGGGDLGLFFC